jgi:phosphatidate cytidylyltransferase
MTWAIGVIFAILVVGTIIIETMRLMRPDRDYTSLRLRIKSWWIMAVVFMVAILLNRVISVIFFAFVSFLTLKEYFTLIPTRRVDRTLLFWTYLAVPVQYLWVGLESYGMFLIFIPVYMFLFLPIHMVVTGDPKGFLRAAGTLHWGLMTTVFSLSHAAFLLILPPGDRPAGAGLLLFLVFLTQFNDVSQFIWGKLLGRRKVVPMVSPGKTWGGLLGGVMTTIILSLVIAPYLTPMGSLGAFFAGIIIGVAGFFGDVTISSLKRDLGIKDTGGMIPGHGGVLDRVDSLVYTAPLFFHFVKYFYY